MAKILALVGNPNSGKTTLFNALTGESAHTGNFPGVTVEARMGTVQETGDTLIDLPGVYSLCAYSEEERVTRRVLLSGQVQGIVNVVDAANPARSLYLTLQLLELGLPVVIAFNMMDEVEAGGGFLDIPALSGALGAAACGVAASRRQGLSALSAAIRGMAAAPSATALWRGEVKRGGEEVMALLGPKEPFCAFAAMQLLQGDETLEKALALSKKQRAQIADVARKTEKACGLDRETAVAAMRYEVIGSILAGRFKKGCSPAENRTNFLDGFTLGGPAALLVFLGVMGALFLLAFGSVGAGLCALLQSGMDAATRFAETLLLRVGVHPLLRELICEGIFAGLSGVLSFMPAVLILLSSLSFLEDCGYMARVACFMDRPMGALGLSGRSFVPLLMGFGCSVPAVLATRTLPSSKDRSMTALLIPFLPCSAKLPVFAAVAGALFGERAGLAAAGLYLFGILLGVLWALLFKNTAFSGEAAPFVMELPPYRMPRVGSVARETLKKGKDFVGRVFSAVLLASVAVWGLGRFGAGLCAVENAEESLLAAAGQRAAWLFQPLGFGDWRAVAALLSGLAAKEAVIGSLSVLLQGQGIESLFTPREGLAFLTFVLLYMPCAASLSAMARELGSRLRAAVAMLTQTGVAWLAAWAVYRLAGFVC